MSPRGTTGLGKPALLPAGAYAPAPTATSELQINFHGEDGRHHSFDVSILPLPGWHESLAASLAARMGPSGSLRTRASAINGWGTVYRLMHFLGKMLRPPTDPSQLEVRHIDAFFRFRTENERIADRTARLELRDIALTFETQPLVGLVAEEVRDRMRPHVSDAMTGISGYSDGELSRLVSAARAEVAALSRRLSSPSAETSHSDAELVQVARNAGCIPLEGVVVGRRHAVERRIAERVFVTRSDVTAMLVLLVATTGWNVETIKELPSIHRVIENLAVEVEITKRRRGSGRWHQTVTWEIGPPERQLTTPGGVYLLLFELMSAAREHLDEPAFWAVWNHSGRKEAGCRNPFAEKLSGDLNHSRWTRRHGIMADSTDGSVSSEFLQLNFNRLKTSIDVRRTRQMGGHLPSAARSNSTAVLFRNYLAGDKSTIDWSRELIADTVAEVERAAWAAHKRALDAQGRVALQIQPDTTVPTQTTADRTQTAWTDCADRNHHPSTGRRCSATFLDCFHCGNCVITGDHLASLLGLLDAIESRRRAMNEEAWWRRYGPTWAAIRHEVLPKFSESELERAQQTKPNDSLLDLVEPRWEQP